MGLENGDCQMRLRTLYNSSLKALFADRKKSQTSARPKRSKITQDELVRLFAQELGRPARPFAE